MNNNFNNTINLTPVEFANFLYKHTDENGVLRMPKGFGTEEERNDCFDEFAMSWDEEKLAQLIADFDVLYVGIEQIAKVYDKIAENEEIASHILRLCKLLALCAPEIVVQNEARSLIGSMALHEFADHNKN